LTKELVTTVKSGSEVVVLVWGDLPRSKVGKALRTETKARINR
jgi:hypothetical protein